MNTFGTAAAQFPLVDTRGIRDARPRFRRDALPLLQRANHFYCPAGRYPCRGWILLDRASYTQLNTYSTALQLNIGDTTSADNVGTLKNLAIVQARCVTRGLASDADAIYLVELTDARGILENRWFTYPSSAAYNVRAPAYQTKFYDYSLNAGAAWNWSTMLADLWGNVSAFLGAFPGLPSTPAGTPEGFQFRGAPLWSSICDVLDHFGMSVTADLTKAAPYGIVTEGAADAAFAALQSKYVTNLEDDLEWIDTGAGRVPATVDIVFRRRNQYYGSEETVRYDSPQWLAASDYTVTIAAPSTFSGAVGKHYLWDDFTIRYDHDGNPVAADVATANAIAAERATQYYARIYRQTAGFMTQTYAGALPFVTGSLVDGVCWRHAGASFDNPSGWETQIVRGPDPPWEGLW